MSKDKNLKRMFDEKFDINKMHDEILDKVKEREKYNINKNLKYCIPIFLVALIFGLISIGKNDTKKFITNESKNDFDTIYINNINDIGTLKYDADIKTINYIDTLQFGTLENLDIPKDINNSTYSAVYVKSVNNRDEFTENNDSNTYDKPHNNCSDSSNNYDKLNNYTFNYQNSSNDRNILISFSNTNKPLRDYHFEKIGKQSKINNIDLTIYKYENLYMTEFIYQNVNYDIETRNISEEELINLLKSIIK